MAISDEMQALPLGNQGEKTGEGPPCGAQVAAAMFASRTTRQAAALSVREPPRSCVRGRVEAVDEPGARPDRGGHSEGAVLRELEGLEVIEDDGLRELPPQ